MHKLEKLSQRPRVNAYLSGRPISYRGLYSGEREPTTNLVRLASLCAEDTEIAVPNIRDFNGKIIYADELHPRVVDGVRLRTSIGNHAADGVVIRKGQSAALATGDCPTIVAIHPGKNFCVVAHAGRQSLLGKYEDGWTPLKNSVVYNIVTKFPPSCRNKLMVWVLLHIRAKNFLHHPKHPGNEEKNRSLISYVCRNYGSECFEDLHTGALSLKKLIAKQFLALGVPFVNIIDDNWDTFSDMNGDGHQWWSNRRGDKDRNMVLVVFPR